MPSIDTHPEDLRVSFGGRQRLSLAEDRADVCGVALVGAVLSASHQVRMVDGTVLETLSCDAAGGMDPHTDPLTAAITTEDGIWSLAFTSTVRPYSTADLRSLVSTLRTNGALVHTFPAPRDAVTAIRLDADGWSTWHAYPEHGLVATSRTVAVLIPAVATAGAV